MKSPALVDSYNSINDEVASSKEELIECYKKLDEKCEEILSRIKTRKNKKAISNAPEQR